MSVTAVAAVGGVAVAGIGAAMSNSSSKRAAAQSAAAQREANQIAREGLAFQKDQYEQTMEDVGALEDIFGPVRDNLANYYKNMSPERYQLQGKEALEKQYERSQQTLDATFSNNGMYNSGQMANAKVALEAQREEVMANNKQNSVNQYNQEQTQWLAMGQNQENAIRGIATNQQGMVGNAFNNQASLMQQGGQFQAGLGMQQAQGWGQMATGGMQIAGYAMGGGFQGKTALTATPATTVPQVSATRALTPAANGTAGTKGVYGGTSTLPASYNAYV